MRCNICGSEMPDNAVFCRNCGAQLNKDNIDIKEALGSNTANNTKPIKPILIFMVSLFAAGIAIGCAALHFSGNNRRQISNDNDIIAAETTDQSKLAADGSESAPQTEAISTADENDRYNDGYAKGYADGYNDGVNSISDEHSEYTSSYSIDPYETYYNEPEPFYGIWCLATKDINRAQNYASELTSKGFNGDTYITTEWSNLNSEKWYVVSAGEYQSRSAANEALSRVKQVCPEAYIKYTGSYLYN